MNSSKNIVWSFILLVIVAALYRIIPGRPFGFAPQWAMAIYAGAVIKDKMGIYNARSFDVCFRPVLSGAIHGGVSDMPGFYEGQWQNYLLFTLLVFVGLAIRN